MKHLKLCTLLISVIHDLSNGTYFDRIPVQTESVQLLETHLVQGIVNMANYHSMEHYNGIVTSPVLYSGVLCS